MFEALLKKAVRAGATYADLRHQLTASHGLEMRNGKIERAVGGREEGIGIQVLYKGGWGFHATNRATVDSLAKALEMALRSAKAASRHVKEPTPLADAKAQKAKMVWKPKKDPANVDA